MNDAPGMEKSPEDAKMGCDPLTISVASLFIPSSEFSSHGVSRDIYIEREEKPETTGRAMHACVHTACAGMRCLY